MLAQLTAINPWKYQFHPEVWVLVVFLTGAYIYVVRVIGPKAVPEGQPPVSRFNIGCFIGAMTLLWTASDWPIHDIGENYLYSAHMLQHMMLSYFMPPLILMATPEWLMRVLVGDGRFYRVVTFFTKPVIAAVLFNAVVIVTHIPSVVAASVASGPLHYTLHFAVVMFSLLMWMPVVGPLPELQITPIGKCIYLFLQSLVPTIPAAWLTFADGAVYKTYDQPVRVWGISVITDQQLAGAIMKTGGGIFLWGVIIFIFFRRFAVGFGEDNSYRREHPMPDAELTGDRRVDDEVPLTTADVERAFAQAVPPADRSVD
jgi:putative membrane protein